MSVAETNDKIVGDLRSTAQDAQTLLNETSNQIGAKTREVRERLSAALENAKETAQRLEEKTKAAARATDRTIREHPYQSIGIAFGVGVLLGVLLARK